MDLVWMIMAIAYRMLGVPLFLKPLPRVQLLCFARGQAKAKSGEVDISLFSLILSMFKV